MTRALPVLGRETADDRIAHIGKPMAVLVDGDVVAAPIVTSPFGQSAVISGNYTRSEAERIAQGIRVP